MLKLSFKTLLMLLTLFAAVNAQYSVRVHSRHEGMQDLNISRPRVFVVNTGTETIRDFYYYYYFTVENNKVPTVERYHTPNCEVTIEDLGNGDYRVKYTYRNVNFRPGDILPDAQGNVIGLRYIDWSPWDKTNDYSFDNSSTFQQNGKIPVFLANGTQISGSTLPDPETPPQPPEIKFSNALYAVYSTEYTDLRDRAIVRGGIAGSLTYAEVGCDAVVNGQLLSGGDIFLRERARINGDVAARQQIKKQNNTVISGTERSFSEINFPQITSYQVNIGTLDAVIGPNGSGTINPGSYREIIIYANSQVTFLPGVYNVDRLIIEPDVRMTFQSQRGKKTDIRVKSECRFGDRTRMQFTGDTIPLSVSIFSEQTSQFRIGTDAVIYGQITAPKASIVVNSRTTVYGMLMGRQVIIEPNATVCKPAALMDFWHSEWAYAKSFDPLTFEYKAVVSDTTRTLQFTFYIPDSVEVLVNGNTYGNGANVPVSLSGSSTDIIVEVRSPENCGKTEYVINIQRSPSYQIFVNANSPALQGREDGRSWESAFKCLQKAIDLAGIEGKEIWVAEGTYYPAFRTDPNDPRSATFMIRPGIKIIGGFKGNETERNPQGSSYLTILSGDLGKNDQRIASWPPSESDLQYMNDNAYHVVTIDGNEGSKAVRIEGVTITGGVANGSGINSVGAGILNKNCSPTLVFVIVEKNYSLSSGAGIMDQGGISEITNCLFRDNISMSGSGAGLYISKGSTKIDASIFAENITYDTTAVVGGGAIFVDKAKLDVVNSVFTFNRSNSKGGAIYNSESELIIKNGTFSENHAALDAQGIWNSNSSITTIKNTILWNGAGKNELGGDGFSVSYSCVTDTNVTGEGNINENPRFVNSRLPGGRDGHFGTSDHGLRLAQNSPCIDAGDNTDFPETDLLGNQRPLGNSVDIGAYEVAKLVDDDKFQIGRLTSKNELLKTRRVIFQGRTEEDYDAFRYSLAAYTIRVKVEKNKHIRNKDAIYAYLRFTDEAEKDFTSGHRVWFYRTGETSGHYEYSTQRVVNGEFVNGKPILLVAEKEKANVNNPKYYLIPCPPGYSNYRIRVPHSQFK